MELLYGMDPLCGWCYGIGPAIQQVATDHPQLKIKPVLAGLVTGPRVGPYAEMEGYIRQASARLHAVTGRAPSDAFFQMIRRPGVIGNSAPPSIAIGAVRRTFPDDVLDFALRVTDAHFGIGADLNDPVTYAAILGEMGLMLDLPDLNDSDLAQHEWQAGRALGLTFFPSLWLHVGGKITRVPVEYDPARLSASLRSALAASA